MQLELKTWAFDILKAIEEIEMFIKDTSEFSLFQKDIKTKRAIERNLEIIGEAMNRMLEFESQIKFTDSRKIVDTRNRIIHGYDSVSDEVIWSIVSINLQVLKREIKTFLS